MRVANNAGASDSTGGALDFTGKLLILLSGLLSALCLTAINSVLPSIERELARGPDDAVLVKQLLGAVALAMAAGAPLGGYLADRIGLRRTLFIAASVYTVAGTAGLYLSSLPLLLVSRLFLGLSAAAIQVLGLTMVNTQLSGNTRAKWMGIHVSFAIFGTLFIHPLAGQLGEISWRLPFALYGSGAMLLLGLLFGSGVAAPAAGKAEAASFQPAGPGILVWFPWHYLVLSFAIGAMTFLPTVSIPFQLREQAGATPAMISYVLLGSSVLGMIMAYLYGPARRILSAHAAFALGFGVASTGALIAASASTLPVVLLGIGLHGLGVSWFVPNIMTALGSKVTKQQQGRAAGLVKAAHFLAMPICVQLIQPFIRQYGEVIAMKAVAAIGFAMFVLMLGRMLTLRTARPLVPAG
ncbi:MAG: MFS transporter [Novosphingobium sp.]